MERVEAVVIGAGVVGLACARALAMAGQEVLVLEAEDAIGTGTSSRNSEVIHAGIYYPPGSLKARLCVAGKHRIYAYCRERGIRAEAVGKLIVATDEAQRPKLAALKDTAERNGVRDLAWLDPAAARDLEPEVACVAALYSPSSGILDSHAFMLSLQGDLEEAGGLVAFRASVMGARQAAYGFELAVGGDAPMTLLCRTLVNAAGHAAPAIARHLRGSGPAPIPQAYLARGNYYALSGVRSPFRHLVYPMPEAAGLGIHATIDLGGQVRFGPDVEWVERLDYAVNPARGPAFAEAIRRYWPGLPDDALVPTYAGIRPKISGPDEPAADFWIAGPESHGIAGLVDLFGIESPGLTSSLAIAEHVMGSLAMTVPERSPALA
ncbi:MAG: NAD(P)/FAD-dependent oxidoreductase [Methylobacteriaceae bacterium]|nr:NAD(P)/FAD-dependent oxidoreductase [Methylobacteriaceae bacterium]